MLEKDISNATFTIGWPLVTMVWGVLTGWFLTAFRAGQKSQKILGAIEDLKEDVGALKEEVKTLHSRSQESKSQIAYMKGRMKK
ncbi:MAG: hypothetical protein COA69_13400 [Robiginitomaculum sp.]|nr:MAG: hypothetical protein COA69_13400 [Robiginitomaculum sp.]